MAKATPAAVTEAEDDEIETLEEVDEAEVVEAPKRTRKAKGTATTADAPKEKKAKAEKPAKPEILGMTTKEAAAKLDITPVKLRRILRQEDFFPDQNYTRYDLSDEIVERVKAAIAAGATSAERKPRAKKGAAVVEKATEEVAEELEALDDLGTDEDDDEALEVEDTEAEEEEEEEEE